MTVWWWSIPFQHEKDWFDNPIETSGQFSGVVIARTRTEILRILTPDKAVEAADSIEVAFPDGTKDGRNP